MSLEAMILKRGAGGRVAIPWPRQIDLVRKYEFSARASRCSWEWVG